MRKRTFVISALIIAANFTAAAPGFAAVNPSAPRTITVTGMAEVKAKPDIAIISTGVESEAVTASEALAKNSAAMTRILATLKKAGIADDDIQTSSFSVAPQYNSNDPEPRRIVGYRVTNQVTVRVRAIAKVGTILDALVQVGSNRINGVAFDIANQKPLLNEARKLAVADARLKAELLVAAAGVTLGKPQQISEYGGGPSPQPMYRATVMAAPASVPIAAGQETVFANVTIVYEIQ